MKITVALLSALFLASFVAAQNDDLLAPSNVCLLMANGVHIADATNCEIYYECINGAPTAYSCPDGQYYNKDSQVCTVLAQSTCSSVNDYCSNYVDGTVAWVVDPYSCNGFYFCDGLSSIGQHGNCPSGQFFNPSSQSCVYENQFNCLGGNQDPGSSSEPSLNDLCTVVPSNVYFASSSDCTAWAVCQGGIYHPGNCPASFSFNALNGDCEYTSDVVCYQTGPGNGTPGPQNPVTNPPAVGSACTEANEFIPDGATCNGYYWCSPVTGMNMWGQCDNFMFFDPVNKTCVDRTNIQCPYNNCVNTEGSKYTWVNDPENCHNYFYCQNNQYYAQTSTPCPKNQFFNEDQQMCTTAQPSYTACVVGNTPPIETTTVAVETPANTPPIGVQTTVAGPAGSQTTVAGPAGSQTTVAGSQTTVAGSQTTVAGSQTTVAGPAGSQTTVAEPAGSQTTVAETDGSKTTVAEPAGSQTTVAETTAAETTAAPTTVAPTTVDPTA